MAGLAGSDSMHPLPSAASVPRPFSMPEHSGLPRAPMTSLPRPLIGYFPWMTTIRQDDFIQSIADALQHISYYHPLDYINALAEAYEREQGPAAKDAIAQILTNSRMCAEGHRPICQDTGIVVVFMKIGMDVRFEG